MEATYETRDPRFRALIQPSAAVERLDLPRHLARSPFPTGVWGPSRVARWSAGAVPFDEAGGQGPQAPDPGRWRLV